jgi:carbonic anhydrase
MDTQKTSNYCLDGLNQSPIELNSKKSTTCNLKCKLLFYYKSSKLNLTREDSFLFLDYDRGSHIVYNGDVYELEKISFTHPTSHKIDNQSGVIEAHLYHKCPSNDQILIVAILYEVNEASSRSKLFFDSFVDYIPKTNKEVSVNMGNDWDAFYMLPELKSFYTYSGSLVNSPCSEGVQWIVMANFANISEKTFRKLSSIIGKNARKIMNNSNIEVYYNSNTTNKSNINQSNRITCMTDKEFRDKCMIMMNKKDSSDRIFGDAKVLISILVILVFLFVLCVVVFVKFGVFDKLIDYFKNIAKQPLDV